MQAVPESRLLARLLVTVTLWASSSAWGQFNPDASPISDISPPDVIQWQAVLAESYPDRVLVVGLRLSTKDDFALYKEKVSFAGPPGFILESMQAPQTDRLVDPISGKEVDVYRAGEFTLRFRGDQPASEQTTVSVTYLGCTSRICLFPYTEEIALSVFAGKAADAPPISAPDSVPAAGPSDKQNWKDVLAAGLSSWPALLVIAFLGGLVTNLTPCVYPMLPITIRILAQRSSSPLTHAGLYASGIMVTYTLLGSLAALTGLTFGSFLSSIWVNLAFATVLALFALSMLGFGNLAQLQELGSRLGRGRATYANTFLMGLGAGLIAAPCTGPVLGALMVYSAGHLSPGQTVITMAVYSAGFALPYVFLGRAAVYLSQRRYHAVIQIGTKLLFAAIMFGLTFYYLRIPLYALLIYPAPYWGWIAAAALILGGGLCYLAAKKEPLSGRIHACLATVVLGLGLFATSQWLTVPPTAPLKSITITTVDDALATARREDRLVLIDNWAEWCEACKRMDSTTFLDEAVVDELKSHWVLAKIDLTEGTAADDDHMARFGIFGLPTLTLITADGDETKAKHLVGYQGAQQLLEELKAFRKK